MDQSIGAVWHDSPQRPTDLNYAYILCWDLIIIKIKCGPHMICDKLYHITTNTKYIFTNYIYLSAICALIWIDNQRFLLPETDK